MYLNDVQLASKLKNVMSSDETNLFISDENIGKQLPEIIEELKGASVWFKTNSLLILMKPNWLYFTPVLKSV